MHLIFHVLPSSTWHYFPRYWALKPKQGKQAGNSATSSLRLIPYEWQVGFICFHVEASVWDIDMMCNKTTINFANAANGEIQWLA